MKPRLLLLGGTLAGLLALVLVIGGADTARAGTFNPTVKITVVDPEPEVNSDITADFNVPAGDVNFAAAVFFIPKDWGIVPGDEIPIGTIVGTLTTQATLGLINGACNNVLPVVFTFVNASLDPSDTVSYEDDETTVEEQEEGEDNTFR